MNKENWTLLSKNMRNKTKPTVGMRDKKVFFTFGCSILLVTRSSWNRLTFLGTLEAWLVPQSEDNSGAPKAGSFFWRVKSGVLSGLTPNTCSSGLFFLRRIRPTNRPRFADLSLVFDVFWPMSSETLSLWEMEMF